MLSRALRDTGLVGTPEEYFLSVDRRAYPDFPTWEDGPHGRPGQSRAEYLASVYNAGTTPNGVFSAKLHWICVEWMLPKFRDLPEFVGLDDLAVFQKAFPELQAVFLTRQNHLAQAVSWARADQENVWLVTDDQPADPARKPTYDGELIGNLIRLIEFGEAQWQQWFERLGLQPVLANYEDLTADLGGEVARIVNELGLGVVDTSHILPATHRQADTINQEWADRFREELPNP